jgi:acyl-coenzyme A thioesterase PaaI-like protein
MNPSGLHLEFEAKGGTSFAQWTASVGWESFQGVIHGGVICAVLDEAMSQAIVSAGYSALTAEIRVRFRNKVSVNDTLCVRGRMVGVRKRKIVAESSLASADGVEMARAWATFLTVRNS